MRMCLCTPYIAARLLKGALQDLESYQGIYCKCFRCSRSIVLFSLKYGTGCDRTESII